MDDDNEWLFYFFIILAVVFALSSCATTQGLPRPDPEDMQFGATICAGACAERHRTFREYRTDGNCICW